MKFKAMSDELLIKSYINAQKLGLEISFINQLLEAIKEREINYFLFDVHTPYEIESYNLNNTHKN